MTRDWILLGVACALAGTAAAGSQITAYIGENGRRVFINAEEAPKPSPARKPANNTMKRDTRDVSTDPVDMGVGKVAQFSNGSNEPAVNVAPERTFYVRGDVDEIIKETAARHNVDAELLRAVIKAESNFNPHAISHKGAVGLMQLMPHTARRLGVRNSFDPEQNIEAGVRHLKYLLGLYDGDLRLSLAAYNAGEGAVERHKGVPPYRETQHYVRKISSWYSRVRVPVAESRVVTDDPERIVKYVDGRGRVHFSNTEGW